VHERCYAAVMLETFKQHCPYCGEPIELIVDESAGESEYVEDCEVCCRPMIIQVHVLADGVTLWLRTENE
jgi:hypothetical protein